ncbi:GerAB/ArcD/ProY family transporter [Mesobacillus zeae]|uniref:Spore gernimation protein n=1 Tax=Mesobacillus zeae TaxID=1917180 RepID=A0A398BLP1_9BACI|nr:GerAB/ArcD/ProY family transporter [Mesobacillus zeae]RID88273.1 spore gernimation protein [Mesobacillus zeae]
MLMNNRNKITTVQATIFTSSYILASGILTLPRTVVAVVKTPDAWLSVLIGGCIAIVLGVIMVKLSQCYPGKTIYQYVNILIGNWAGKTYGILLVIYFVVLSAYEVRTLSDVTSYMILEGTPAWAISMPFIWIGYYLLQGWITSLARLFEIVFPISVAVFLLVILMSTKSFEMDNLRPFLGEGIQPVLKGLTKTVFAYIGFESMLFLVAYMEKPEKAVKSTIFGIGIPILFYVITMVAVIAALSIDGVVHRTWPTLDLIRSYEMKGLLFERFESFLLVIWSMQIFSTFCITYFVAFLGISQMFNIKTQKVLLGLLPFLFLISMTPRTIDEVFSLGDILGKSAIILFGFIPLPLLILAKWKGRVR